MKTPTTLPAAVMLVAALGVSAATAQVPTTGTTDLVAEARKLTTAGKLDEAVETYRRAVEANPNQWDAHYGLGVALDLKGTYAEAREHLAKAIEAAPQANKPQALTAMGVSYAFESKGNDAARFYQQIFDARLAAKTFMTAGEAANALARIYLESGDTANALKWYRTGYETAGRQPDLSAAQRDLVEMRWHNAQARIDARRGQLESARRHVGEARALMEKGTNPEQVEFMPYLEGYVAFYAGQPDDAVNALQKGNLDDPFVLVLLAQALEKKGEKAKAEEHYRKILTINSHNIQNAFARPIAKRKVT
jgi:Flp pilus assembly protein TadD